MRTFIAIDLPSQIKEKIVQIQQTFKECDLAFKWVKAEYIHLTLKFLGNIEEKQVAEVKKIITEVAQKNKALKAKFTEFGFFPNEKRPRVFFIATSHEDLLKSIAEELESKLEDIGFLAEHRFKSHLTLARIKSLENIDCLKGKCKEVKLTEEFTINELILFKSILTRSGPIYEKIFTSPLAA
jgi:2'-5' RNA ligase